MDAITRNDELAPRRRPRHLLAMGALAAGLSVTGTACGARHELDEPVEVGVAVVDLDVEMDSSVLDAPAIGTTSTRVEGSSRL